MRYSKSFIKTQKETPHGVTSVNQSLLQRGSFIDQLSSGIFSYLPLGLKVLKKIEKIIIDQLNEIGVQQILLPSVNPTEIWQKSGRFNEIGDELVKLSLNKQDDFVLAMTHEEAVTTVATSHIKTYQDLPFTLNQISKKIRNEARPRGGLIRLKEFTMQDAYSFSATSEELDNIFKNFTKAYEKIFKLMSLEAIQVQASSGIMGGSDSIEFMLITPSGEDRIFLCGACDLAVNAELTSDVNKCPKCGGQIKEYKAIELGHIFKLGTKYSVKMDLKFADKEDKEKYVLMGCYGIGIDRLIGAIVEKYHDEKGIIWPENVAPAKVYLIDLEGSRGEEIYNKLQEQNIEVLFDDRKVSAGVKFSDADLLGLPYRIVISEKTLKDGKVELKKRDEKEEKLVGVDKITDVFDNGKNKD